MGGKDSIINGAKDILKAILLGAVTLLLYVFLLKFTGVIGLGITLFLLFIAAILFIIGIARILYGIITL
ncbi:MAG: hypothetical protein AT717_06125 [Vulcanisaeta sp. CIS_19]|jgi:hypothetical protein|nr:MAG: hypothetical protein AT717_06125 [Vulcanisaeta sp. CIS_19]